MELRQERKEVLGTKTRSAVKERGQSEKSWKPKRGERGEQD